MANDFKFENERSPLNDCDAEAPEGGWRPNWVQTAVMRLDALLVLKASATHISVGRNELRYAVRPVQHEVIKNTDKYSTTY